MKKALLVHFGTWFTERDKSLYKDQILRFTELLQASSISIQLLEHLPTNDEMEPFDAIIFISLSFREDARKIKSETEKLVFVITGLPSKEDDFHSVICIDKSHGYLKNMEIVSQIILENPKYLIRTASYSVAKRDYRLNWYSMPDCMAQNFEDFLSKDSARKDRLERGEIITIESFCGHLREDIRLTHFNSK